MAGSIRSLRGARGHTSLLICERSSHEVTSDDKGTRISSVDLPVLAGRSHSLLTRSPDRCTRVDLIPSSQKNVARTYLQTH